MPANPSPGAGAARASQAAELKAFVSRLHFYVGLLTGPFLLVAALTGVLYVLTPQLEDFLYKDALTATAEGPPRPLAEQAAAAQAVAGPAARLFALRPATAPGLTTRVMFITPGLGESESRAIFLDPASLAVRGDMIAYGTSGVLPLRTTIDYLHRNLMLGDAGRLYSELAASWLWLLALGGVLMWTWRRTGRLARQAPKNVRLRTRNRHGVTGLVVALGLLFLSATGLTWSQLAGARIDALRGALGWVTPGVTVALAEAPREASAAAPDPHAHHHGGGAMPAAPVAHDAVGQLDAALAAARAAGIDSSFVEIRLPRPGRAWLVREYDRSWPTQVDTVTLDPRDLSVTSRADFATFPIVAKLIRWGIDAHMGVLFGLPNQLLMAALGIGLMVATVYGYRIWWQSRPAPGAVPRSLTLAWLRLGWTARGGVVLLALAIGWTLPMAGFSFLLFWAVDAGRWALARRRSPLVAAE
ncbi:PepSY domain-containing protein [Roseomonas sp. 18066]|uniref:PepSY-associated TM helix domain-containing protein n=1 Tax=Roseomonas sp. 18066 TaxID=2681412 RepID=UPI0013576DDC|nr:PepSY-associated TM helix domain-containing protein [Roseomonas sp. 18066]